jgi:hypothetical protein
VPVHKTSCSLHALAIGQPVNNETIQFNLLCQTNLQNQQKSCCPQIAKANRGGQQLHTFGIKEDFRIHLVNTSTIHHQKAYDRDTFTIYTNIISNE